MKKLYTLLFAFVAVLGLSAQNENLLSNASFEEWGTNKPIDWDGVTGNATLTKSDDAHTGSASVSVAGKSSNVRLASKNYTLKPGSYTLSAYVKQTGTTAGQYRLGYVILTDGKAASGDDYKYLTNATAVSPEWTLVSADFELTTETEVNIIVMNSKNGNGADILVDDISLTSTDGGIGEGGDVTTPPVEPGEIAGTGEGTVDSPYDVARALSLIENKANDANAEVYVVGTISSITEISTQYGNATYDIVDTTDGAALKVYRGYYLGGEKFTAEDQLKVGDKVVVCGKLVLYGGTTPEVNASNKLYSINGETTVGGGEEPEPENPTPGGEIGTVTGNTITFAATDLGLESGAKVTDVTLVDGTVVTFAQGEGNNAPAYYTTGGAAIRMYALNTLTVKAQKAIASVVVKHTAGNGGNETLTASKGTLTRDAEANTLTVSGVNADEVVLFNDYEKNSSGTQLRVVSIDITYVSTGIAGVEQQTAAAATYDLSGRRVSAAGKGLYIVGGKKVLVK